MSAKLQKKKKITMDDKKLPFEEKKLNKKTQNGIFMEGGYVGDI